MVESYKMQETAMINDVEEWRIIKRFPDYAASNLERVKRINNGHNNISKSGKIINAFIKNGYLRLGLYKNNKQKQESVHRLILEAFVGDGDGMQGNHKNGIKIDNRLENLEWCTRSYNIKHAFRIGLINMKNSNHPFYGKNHSEETKSKIRLSCKSKNFGKNSMLNKIDVMDIKIVLKSEKYKILHSNDIADLFNVTKGTISHIKNNKTWHHVNI